MPGILFSSLTVYPLYWFTRRLFSEKVAIVTAVFYLINPLCWLQAERPASDAMGLFFLILSVYFLFCVFEMAYKNIAVTHLYPSPSWGGKSNNLLLHISTSLDRREIKGEGSDTIMKFKQLFIGSLVLGLGLGVRLSYFPFIVLWLGVLFYLVIQKKYYETNSIFYGLIGFAVGVCVWLLPQVGYVGWHTFLHNGLSFSYGHFTDWGGSVITFGGLKRIDSLIQSIWFYGLGGWWYDSSLLGLLPSVIMVMSVLYLLKRCRYDHRWWFLGAYIIPYALWVILGQNPANPRHILPIIPIILMLIAYGLCKVYEEGDRVLSMLLTSVFIMSMSAISLKIVIRYHDTVPAPIQLIQFIERQFNTNSTRVYCGEEKRFFDYYAPLWDVRNVRDATALNIDLQSSLGKPQKILFIQTTRETEQFCITHPPIITLERNPYADATGEGLRLYELTNSQVDHSF